MSEQSNVVKAALGISESEVARYAELSQRMEVLSWQKGGLDSDEWNALLTEAKVLRADIDLNNTGSRYYELLSQKQGGAKGASEYLRSIGVAGIRYLDGDSRTGGEGSHNYVIFSDSEIELRKTYFSTGNTLVDKALEICDPLLKAMADKGLIKLHRDSSSLPYQEILPEAVQGLTTPDGSIHIVANAMDGNAKGVVLHEVFHSGVGALIGQKSWSKLLDRLNILFHHCEKSSGTSKDFFEAARQRVESAKVQGAVQYGMEVEEFGAYAIEEYQKAPGSVRKWVADLAGAIKAWSLSRLGVQLGKVTPAQLSSLAVLALHSAQNSRLEYAFSVVDSGHELKASKFASEMSGMNLKRHSKSYKEADSSSKGSQVNIDGVLRQTENSLGRPIASDETALKAFWNWFGNSAMVDSDGRPIVMFHSTLDDISEFDKHGQFMGYTGVSGISVTDSPEMASRYLDRYGDFRYDGKRFDKNVMPVYVKTENPLYRNEPFKAPISLGSPLPKDYCPQLVKQGYDALIREDAISRRGSVKHSEAKNAIKGLEVVIFNPTNVKSAIGNFGTFDPNNRDIRFSVSSKSRESSHDSARINSNKAIDFLEKNIHRTNEDSFIKNLSRVKR